MFRKKHVGRYSVFSIQNITTTHHQHCHFNAFNECEFCTCIEAIHKIFSEHMYSNYSRITKIFKNNLI